MRSHLVKRSENCAMKKKVGVVSEWSHAKMVKLQLERFSALVSDVCACLIGVKVRLDHFWRKIIIRLPIT